MKNTIQAILIMIALLIGVLTIMAIQSQLSAMEKTNERLERMEKLLGMDYWKDAEIKLARGDK